MVEPMARESGIMGKVARKYLARAARVKTVSARARGDVAKVLVEGLREATIAELYSKTPLPVTKRMLRSIKPRFLGAHDVAVGFDTGVAPHAPHRLKKTGKSKMGGHTMDMKPGIYLDKHTRAKIRKIMAKCQTEIIGE